MVRSGGMAQLVDCSTGVGESLGATSRAAGTGGCYLSPSTREAERQERGEFKVILIYVTSSQPDRVRSNPSPQQASQQTKWLLP